MTDTKNFWLVPKGLGWFPKMLTCQSDDIAENIGHKGQVDESW